MAMTSLENITLVEAWAWLHASGGLPEWDDAMKVGVRGHQRMEVLFFGHMRWKYTYIKPRWYKYALLGAMTYLGHDDRNLVQYVKNEVDKKFKRKPPFEDPLPAGLRSDVLRNMPPFEGEFENARRLTKTMLALMQDDWAPARWYKEQGYPLLAHDLRDLRPDLTIYKINQKINAKESNDD